MKITKLYVADHSMKWNGINLKYGDLYGHHDFYGLVYSHVPTYGNFVYFNCVEDDHAFAMPINTLWGVDAWETADGRIYFDPIFEQPEEHLPVAFSSADSWDGDVVNMLLEECALDEEVAMYVDGNDAYFLIYPIYASPDFNAYGECIETWCM